MPSNEISEYQQVPCIMCGDVGDLPKGVEYDEYVCGSCQRVEAEDAGH